jgi:hypothetical protein
MIYTRENPLIIGDHNWQDHAIGGPHAKGSFGCLRPKWKVRRNPLVTFADLSIPLIPEQEWGDRTKEMQADRSFIKDVCQSKGPQNFCLDQNGRGQCHVYGHCGGVRSATILQGGVIRLPSAQALAYNTWDGRSWGNNGADPAESFQCLVNEGAARHTIWPMDGEGQSSKFNTPQAKADTQNMRLVRAVELGHEAPILQEVFSCIFSRIAGSWCQDWWSHHEEAMCWAGFSGTEVCPGGRNSWGADYGEDGYFLLSGSKKTPDGAWAFAEVTRAS